VAVGAASSSASLIGDALLRELIEHAGPGRRHGASPGEPRSPGQDGGAEHRNGSSSNGVPGLDRRRADPPAPPVHRTDAGVADTVVFERDRRHDSTIAVPPVRPTREAGYDDAPAGPDASPTETPARTGGHPTTPDDQGGPAAPGAAHPRPDGPRHPSTTDTDGLGIGDLLAGALAAYRGI
jgi:hypothetical protein